MKVFISWSVQRSAAVADALRYWLPKVIQALEPWMSADDIEKGIREPLAQFQATRAQKDDVRKLVFSINGALGDSKLSESELGETFEVWWPKLEERLDRVGETTTSVAPARSDRELLEEILETVRSQSKRDRQIWLEKGSTIGPLKMPPVLQTSMRY